MKRSEMQAKATNLQSWFREFALVNPERAFGIGVLCGALLILLAPLLVPVLLTAAALVGVFWLLAEQEEEVRGGGETVRGLSKPLAVSPESKSVVESELSAGTTNGPISVELGSVRSATSSNTRSIGFSLGEGEVDNETSITEIESYKPARPKRATSHVEHHRTDRQVFSKSEAPTEAIRKPRKPRKAASQKSKDDNARNSSGSTQKKNSVKKGAATGKNK